MMSWILSMVHYPDEMKKLQEEIDNVIGEDRLPEFDDVPQLPRVRAVAKEVCDPSTLKLFKHSKLNCIDSPMASSHGRWPSTLLHQRRCL